jgi:hypothetical protein
MDLHNAINSNLYSCNSVILQGKGVKLPVGARFSRVIIQRVSLQDDDETEDALTALGESITHPVDMEVHTTWQSRIVGDAWTILML